MTAARTRPAQAQAQPGKHTATLRRGRVYLLAGLRGGKDTLFERGVAVEVSPETFAHLAEHALDRITLREAGGKITNQLFRKFALRGPDGTVLPKIHSEVVTVDGALAPEEDY